MNVLEKILEEIDKKKRTYKNELSLEVSQRNIDEIRNRVSELSGVEEIIRSHMNEITNDERLVKKFVINRTVVKDFYNTPLYAKGCCPKCGCELKSCETDYCRVCGQALIWENPEGGL